MLSYTHLFSSPLPEDSSPSVKPKFRQEKAFKDINMNNKQSDQIPDTKRKFSVPKAKFPKSKDKVNVWTKQGRVESKKKAERAPCWFVVFIFCCGVSKENPWYSLLGKGELFNSRHLTSCLFPQINKLINK